MLSPAPEIPALDDSLTGLRTARLRAEMAASGFDAVVCTSMENVFYATGYRSSPGSHRRAARLAAVVTQDELFLVGPCAEGAAALAAGVGADEYVPYGRFFFESTTGTHAATTWSDTHPSLPAALADASSVLRDRRVAVDEAELGDPGREVIEAAAARETVAASGWLQAVRARKLDGEVDRLRAAAVAAENGIARAVQALRPGITERQLAALVGAAMSEHGAVPRFVVVTAGERSAYSDVFPSDTPVLPGDLVRFDVGCTYDGYSSDVGRQAVMGDPTPKQAEFYEAILAGESAQLAAIGPGTAARELFNVAVSTTESRGLVPYRRQHCGHGIGMDTYEGFGVTPTETHILAPGNVLCVETPYYELGWGGMMVEDTALVTAEGAELLTTSSRDLMAIDL